MSSVTSSRPTLADGWRLVSYFWDFDLFMSDYPRRDYKRIAKSLKAEVRAAAADVGMRRALADLGTPRQLASGYLAQITGQRPRWNTGAVAAAFALLLPHLALLFFVGGSTETLLEQGGGTARLGFFGAEVVTFVSDDALGTELHLLAPAWWAWVLPLTAAAFLVAARAWRALPARR